MFESILDSPLIVFVFLAVFIVRMIAGFRKKAPPPPPVRRHMIHFEEENKTGFPPGVPVRAKPAKIVPAKTFGARAGFRRPEAASYSVTQKAPEVKKPNETPGQSPFMPAKLSPLQQAVVMSEILGPPKSMQD